MLVSSRDPFLLSADLNVIQTCNCSRETGLHAALGCTTLAELFQGNLFFLLFSGDAGTAVVSGPFSSAFSCWFWIGAPLFCHQHGPWQADAEPGPTCTSAQLQQLFLVFCLGSHTLSHACNLLGFLELLHDVGTCHATNARIIAENTRP